MRKARNKREMFINILDMWLTNELTVIGEFCISNLEKAREDAREEYQEYMRMYDELDN